MKVTQNITRKTYIIGAGWIVKKSFDALTYFLPTFTRNKIEFLGSDFKKVLGKEIGAENLE